MATPVAANRTAKDQCFSPPGRRQLGDSTSESTVVPLVKEVMSCGYTIGCHEPSPRLGFCSLELEKRKARRGYWQQGQQTWGPHCDGFIMWDEPLGFNSLGFAHPKMDSFAETDLPCSIMKSNGFDVETMFFTNLCWKHVLSIFGMYFFNVDLQSTVPFVNWNPMENYPRTREEIAALEATASESQDIRRGGSNSNRFSDAGGFARPQVGWFVGWFQTVSLLVWYHVLGASLPSSGWNPWVCPTAGSAHGGCGATS